MSEQAKRRIRLGPKDREQVLAKTAGHCHFCGDALPGDNWVADRVHQLTKDGAQDAMANLLPACRGCDRLRWDYKGPKLRSLLTAGVVGLKHIKVQSALGKLLEAALKRHERAKAARRVPKVVDSAPK